MSFHKNNFGKFSDYVSPYADMNGFVPEIGDDPSLFDYDMAEVDDDSWDNWVANAVLATGEAEQAIADWRDS